MMKLILSILLSASIGISCSKKTEDSVLNNSTANTTKVPVVDDRKTDLKAGEAQSFCKKNNFNTDFCILIDMSLHSGLSRFFVYDFNQKKSPKNSWLAMDVETIRGVRMNLKTIQLLVTKMEAIFLHWGNIE